jgi:cytochrome c oxidase subunit 2
MKRLEILGVMLIALVLVGTPVAVFAGQRYLNTAPHEYTIVAHTAEDGGFTPSQIVVTQGERVRLRLTSADVVHGLYVSGLDVQVAEIYPGRYATVEFTPTQPGTYPFVCTILCSPLHGTMQGTIVVLPSGKSG